MTRCLLTLALLASSLAAQTLNLSPGRLMLRPGESTVITFSITGQPTPPTITAFQWTENTGLTASIPVTTGTAGAKQLACGPSVNNARTCLVFSVGTATIANGQVVTVTVTVPLNASAGTLTYAAANTLAATAAGTAVPLGAPPPITFTIVSKLDLNADGKIDIVDVNTVLQQAIGNQAILNCDVNGDSVCNVLDVAQVAGQAVP